jgi:hypothetical protein
MIQPPKTWRVSATTTIAAAMKTTVAVIERGDHDEARRHLWNRQGEAEQHGRERRRNQSGDEGRAPGAVAAGRIDQPGKDAGHAGDAAVQQHQHDGCQSDQRAADGG